MVWKLENPESFESDKIAAVAVPYLIGRGLDVGCGMRKVWPHAIGIDNGHHAQMFGHPMAADIRAEAHDLSLFADSSLDFIFSSHTLEHFPEEKVQDILKEWARVLKKNGHLVLYVPSANLYPKVGEAGANPDHKWNVYPGDIEKHLLAVTQCGWTQLENEERGREGAHPLQEQEYSLFEVYQKRDDGVYESRPWQRNPEGKKRCLVIRYGAIGDQIIAASCLPALRAQGYHITYCTTPKAKEVVWHDPNVDEWLIQEKDQVPNVQLAPYWKALEERYDKIINLSESVEGALLALPGRSLHAMSQEARHRITNVNYLELTHDIAQVPHDFAPYFHATEQERYQVEKMRKKIKGPVIAWVLNGSSPHKVYPFTQVVIKWLLEKTPAHVYLMADPSIGVTLQDAVVRKLEEEGVDVSRITKTAGDWPVRKVLSFCKFGSDIVIGPETGPLNAVCFEDVPKIIMLSHSSQENLTKHWKNTTVLEPDKAKAPCFPCHRLHYTWEFCPQAEETAAAICASSITPESVFDAIMKIFQQKYGKAA